MDNEYYEIEFETIIRSKTQIYNDDITIKCQNMNGIVTYFEGKAIDIFIEEIKNNCHGAIDIVLLLAIIFLILSLIVI